MSKRSLPKIPKKKILLALGVVLVMTAVWRFHSQIWPGGLGIDKEQSVTTRSVETVVKDAQGNTTKTVETTKIDDGKTLWDWLSLLGVPVSLAVLGYVLQQLQQKRAEALAKEQREIAADETKEEVLQVYFDRLSVLLVDKNLLAIAAKGDQATNEEHELLDSAMDVIRARTLSILRRFENDPERKTSVIRFLIEADIVSKLRLNLRGANLRGANLCGANLCGANLSDADLRNAVLNNVALNGADLSNTDLSNADLSNAALCGADLSNAKLWDVNLSGTDLSDTDLSGAKLWRAQLRNANIGFANLAGADLNFANLTGVYLTRTYLSKAILTNTILNDANLSDANLSFANLCNANLSFANLSNTNLSDANLSNANLSNAGLSNANLTRANLSHSDLSDVTNLIVDQLHKANLCHTKLPKGVNLDPDRDCKRLEMPLDPFDIPF
jgi:uncharacterized protein YjbI with pentapeptide repeats